MPVEWGKIIFCIRANIYFESRIRTNIYRFVRVFYCPGDLAGTLNLGYIVDIRVRDGRWILDCDTSDGRFDHHWYAISSNRGWKCANRQDIAAVRSEQRLFISNATILREKRWRCTSLSFSFRNRIHRYHLLDMASYGGSWRRRHGVTVLAVTA